MLICFCILIAYLITKKQVGAYRPTLKAANLIKVELKQRIARMPVFLNGVIGVTKICNQTNHIFDLLEHPEYGNCLLDFDSDLRNLFFARFSLPPLLFTKMIKLIYYKFYDYHESHFHKLIIVLFVSTFNELC